MSCDYYKWESSLFGGDYYCTKKGSSVSDDQYRRYCRDYNYRECPIYNHSNSSSSCYITTVTCEILKLSDNDVVLSILRGFRDDILQKDKQYKQLLLCYDYVGPKIAENLKKDEHQLELARIIYKEHLVPISKQIIKGNYDEAVRKYKHITEWLIVNYKLEKEYKKVLNNRILNKYYDQSIGGHGKKRIKKLIKKKLTGNTK